MADSPSMISNVPTLFCFLSFALDVVGAELALVVVVSCDEALEKNAETGLDLVSGGAESDCTVACLYSWARCLLDPCLLPILV